MLTIFQGTKRAWLARKLGPIPVVPLPQRHAATGRCLGGAAAAFRGSGVGINTQPGVLSSSSTCTNFDHLPSGLATVSAEWILRGPTGSASRFARRCRRAHSMARPLSSGDNRLQLRRCRCVGWLGRWDTELAGPLIDDRRRILNSSALTLASGPNATGLVALGKQQRRDNPQENDDRA